MSTTTASTLVVTTVDIPHAICGEQITPSINVFPTTSPSTTWDPSQSLYTWHRLTPAHSPSSTPDAFTSASTNAQDWKALGATTKEERAALVAALLNTNTNDVSSTDSTPDSSDSSPQPILLAESLSYTPTHDDVGHLLRFTVTPVDTDGQVSEPHTFTTEPVEAVPLAPLPRSLLTADPPSDSPSFRILSYSILPDFFVTGIHYKHCPKYALGWDYRAKHFYDEIASADADILCLQLVEPGLFENELQPRLQDMGFVGLYMKKTRNRRDGVATLWNKERFTFRKRRQLPLNDAIAEECSRQQVDQTYLGLSQNSVLLAVTLRNNDSGNEFVLANTHFTYLPERRDVQCLQAWCVVQALQDTGLPYIWAANTNSTPDEPVYSLLSAGDTGDDARHHIGLSETYDDVPDVSINEQWRTLAQQRYTLLPEGAQPLASAYAQLAGHEPSYTTLVPSFRGCVDYLWYTPSAFAPVSALDVMDPTDLENEWGGLPNPVYSSDHVWLVADFVEL